MTIADKYETLSNGPNSIDNLTLGQLVEVKHYCSQTDPTSERTRIYIGRIASRPDDREFTTQFSKKYGPPRRIPLVPTYVVKTEALSEIKSHILESGGIDIVITALLPVDVVFEPTDSNYSISAVPETTMHEIPISR